MNQILPARRLLSQIFFRKSRSIYSMSDQLSEAFQKGLKLEDNEKPGLNLADYPEIQQAQARQWLTLSQRFPTSFPELNDTLRESTFLLGGTSATEVDGLVFAKASNFLKQLNEEEIVSNRHIVRWGLLIQKLVGTKVLDINLDTKAPRELPKKKEKKDGNDKAEDKKAGDKKADKKASKKSSNEGNVDESAAAASASVATAASAASATGNSENNQGKKKEKKEKKKEPKPAAPPARPVSPGMIDFRVGFIQKAIKHPDADSLYVSTIDVGEEEPRTICSGLVQYVPIEEMQQRFVVVVANLKPVKMRGIVSNGMVLCASVKEDNKVEFVKVPEGATAGDKIFFEGFDEEPESVLNPKKKIWETVQPNFTTTDSLNVVYKDGDKQHKLVNKKGQEFLASTIKNAAVS